MVRKIDVTKLPPRIKSDNPGHVRAGRFLGDGRSLVVAADTHPVRIFDVASGEPIAEVPYAPPDPKEEIAPAIAATASGLVILGGYASDLIAYDVNAKAERYRVPGSPNNYPVFAVSDAGGFLATTTPAAERSVLVQLRKLETGDVVWQTKAQGDISAYAMAFSRDGKQLAAGVHGLAYVYATGDKKLTNTVMIYPTFGNFEVAFTADGQKLIAGQRHAQLWDIATGRRVLHYGPFSDLCHAIDVSPDGKYVATGHMGSDGRVWEIDTGTFFRRLGKNVYPPG
jgi:WD40 repeat protein